MEHGTGVGVKKVICLKPLMILLLIRWSTGKKANLLSQVHASQDKVVHELSLLCCTTQV